MTEPKMSKEKLERRREELLDQLGEDSRDVRLEFDRDPEEQALQVEQHDVSIGIVESLRRELADVEGKLLDYEEG